MEGNSNTSTGSQNGTDTSVSYALADGKILEGVAFNGSTSKIALGTAFDYALSAFSIGIWFYPTVSTIGTLFGRYKVASDFEGFGIRWNDAATDQVTINFREAVTGNITNGSALSKNAWHYVLVTSGGVGNTVTMYVDGSSVGTATLVDAGAETGSYPAFFGIERNTTFPFTGNLDEIGIWDRELSSAEALQLWNSGAGLTYPFTSPANGNFLALM